MPRVTSDTRPTHSSKRLFVRLTKLGEPDRTLDFHAGSEEVRVIGCSPNADFVLRDAGILPMHCYFEREQSDIWLAAAQGTAAIRVNYQPVVGRVKLGRRSIVELGETRFQIVVSEEDESEPLHGPFGTEVLQRHELSVNAELFETKPVNTQVALGEFPTTAWELSLIHI